MYMNKRNVTSLYLLQSNWYCLSLVLVYKIFLFHYYHALIFTMWSVMCVCFVHFNSQDGVLLMKGHVIHSLCLSHHDSL